LKSRIAIARQTVSSAAALNAESTRRNTTALESVPIAQSPIQLLVAEVAVLEYFSNHRDEVVATHVRCIQCNFTSKATVEQPAVLSEILGHLGSRDHAHLRQHAGGLEALWGGKRVGPAPAPPPPPDLSRPCWGFHDKVLSINAENLSSSALLHYDSRLLDWYPESQTSVKLLTTAGQEPLVINGTFRSKNPPCQRFAVFLSGACLSRPTCLSCASIGSRRSFRNALVRASYRSMLSSRKINLRYLVHSSLLEIARLKSLQVVSCQKKIWLARQMILCKSLQLRSVKEELEESMQRGDTKWLIQSIIKFSKDGKGNKRSALVSFICDLMKSAEGRDGATDNGSKGMRWTETSKQIFGVIKKKVVQRFLCFSEIQRARQRTRLLTLSGIRTGSSCLWVSTRQTLRQSGTYTPD